MATRYFALVYGLVFLVVGIAGFIPALVTPMTVEEPALIIETGAGRLFGLFPVNVLHNIVHLAFGVWGIIAWRSVPAAFVYARGVAVIYALFFVMGFIPLLWTTFGLVPLFGNDVWLHFVLAAIAAYFGFARRPERDTAYHDATATRR